MKRIVAIVMLCTMLLMCGIAHAEPAVQAESEGALKQIGLTIYLTDAEGEPMKDTVLLVQRGLEAADGYEGKTDGRGAVTIPRFPLSGFVLATRSGSDTVTGLVNVTLYPGDETKIINKPILEKNSVTVDELQETALSRNLNGARQLELSGDELQVNNYEVEVAAGARGLACLFQLDNDHALLLRGVGEGEAGQIAPEPTLPPGDEDRPDTPAAASEPVHTTAPVPTAAEPASPSPDKSASPSPLVTESESPSAAESTSTVSASAAAPSGTAADIEPTVTPIPTSTASIPPATSNTSSPPTAEPSATPMPTPIPTSAPTTPVNLVNMKLFLKDTSGNSLPYYVAVLNSIAQATCNEDGEAYFTNVPTDKTNQLIVRNTNGDQVGACGLDFVEGDSTQLGPLNAGGTYTISYARGTQDVYVEIVVNIDGNAETPAVLQDASATPLEPGTQPSVTPEPPAQSGSAVPGADDIVGAASTGSDAPSLSGYFSNEAGIAISGATIRLVNEDTKNLSSSITNSQGAFGMGKLPPAHYSLNAIDPQGRNLGTVKFTVARGKRTQVKTGRDGQTYLTEAADSGTVYMDLRELSNGTVDLMYASKSPLTAPAVLTTSFSPIPSSGSAQPSASEEDLNVAADVEDVDIEAIERPGQEQEADAGTVVFVVVLCAMGVAVAAVLLTRHARIR